MTGSAPHRSSRCPTESTGSSSASVVAAGRVDEQHVGVGRQAADRLLQQRAGTQREEPGDVAATDRAGHDALLQHPVLQGEHCCCPARIARLARTAPATGEAQPAATRPDPTGGHPGLGLLAGEPLLVRRQRGCFGRPHAFILRPGAGTP